MIEGVSCIPYSCQVTGKCCINNLVPLSPFDVFRIGKKLDITAEELFLSKTLAYKISGSTYFMEPVIQMRSNLACPFLGKDSENEIYKCSIYEGRPFTCRIFPLKYDPDNDIYLRSERGEARCPECVNPEKEISIEEYLIKNEVGDLPLEYAKYRNLVEKLSLMGYNVKELPGKKLKQKLFFKIQKLLFETFPSNDREEEYPWLNVYQTIQNWIQNSELES